MKGYQGIGVRSLGLGLAAGLTVSSLGCGGGNEPTVEVVSATPSLLIASRDDADDLTIQVHYTDPNGDLGSGVAEVHDCRAENLVSRFAIPPIASRDAIAEGASIEGDMTLVLANVDVIAGATGVAPTCQDLDVGDARSFCVILVDAAGNASKGSCTRPIDVRSQ